MIPSDEALMQAIREGHVSLLGTLFTRYADRVLGRCFQIVGDRQEADDLLQEAFLRVLRYRNSFKGTASFSSWLYRITTNVCLDHLKAANRQRTVAQELVDSIDFAPPAPDDGRIAILRAAFDRLAPEKRDLLVKVRVQGLGYARIAAECGATEGAVRVRVHRALRELKSIADSLQEGPP